MKSPTPPLYDVILAPRLTEKSTRLADRHRQFVFTVRRDASKPLIRAAVEKLFNVQVEAVRVLTVKGKAKGGARTPGRRSDWKKAYVTLKPGQDIKFAGESA
jgi:large subunit ribosomal protein L23